MLSESSQVQNYSLATRLLIACGAIGPLLFIVVFLIEDVTRPGYSAWHNFVSELSLSDQGWEQIVNFLICGVLVFCFAIGLRQVFRAGKGAIWGPLLLGIFGILLIIVGIFVTDPSLGYPPGTSRNIQTLHGIIHGLGAPFTFGSLAIAIFVLARRFAGDPAWRGWAIYSTITGIIVVLTFIACLAVAVLDEKGILTNAPVGLLERIAIITGWVWISLLALALLRKGRTPEALDTHL
ncbi:MAG TPA: DUF998 domain-containing protein [Ktedonobacteraceae bacterium]|jgi:hypothetical membrane protein|nr:DUF998 domain-containing protein [Ktedonobacteraceae bacterium]